MKKLVLLILLTVVIVGENQAQTRYLIKFKDKNNSPFSLSTPGAYLSQRSIDRRTRYSIAYDSTDLPVNPSYITQIKAVAGVNFLNASKWLNAVTIQTTSSAAITTISALPFVQSVTGIAARTVTSKFEPSFTPIDNGTARTSGIDDFFNYGTNAYNEIHLHNGEFLHNIGLRGQTLRIAMMDAGFQNFSTMGGFDSINMNGQVLDTLDFVDLDKNVKHHSHGTNCLSTIAANIPGSFIGTAPKAGFYLYRTEDAATEYKIELFNWACAAERADSSGADVISTSLGYSIQFSDGIDIPYSDMNGNTTMTAIAGDLAAKKGILVFASIGNDGNDPNYKLLSTPSDGDSVIAVGAVNTSGAVGSFSSYGPSSDGQVKPDMAAVGVSAVILNTNNSIGFSNGTSFACPKMAGLGTCLWQGFPEFNNMKIRAALWQAGSITSAPNDRIGYGVPNVKLAFSNLLKEFSTANGSITNCKTTLNWNTKDMSAMRYEIERKAPGESNYSKVADVAAVSGVAVLANQSYQKNDTLINVQAGTVSYRIRQIIDTAAASFTGVYIDTVDINLATSCITTGIDPVNPLNGKIYVVPNPAFSSELTLKVEITRPITEFNIHIVDMKGRLMTQFRKTKGSGAQNYTLPISRLAKGNYVIAVYDGKNLLASKEFVKL